MSLTVLILLVACGLQFGRAASGNIVSLNKCCANQGQVELSNAGCATCRYVEDIKSRINIEEFPKNHLFKQFELNNIFLPPSKAQEDEIKTCSHQMNRMIFSLISLQHNLTSDGFLRLGENIILPKGAFCFNRLGTTHAEIFILSRQKSLYKLNKCCPRNHSFDVQLNKCAPNRKLPVVNNANDDGIFGNQFFLRNNNNNNYYKYHVAENWLKANVERRILDDTNNNSTIALRNFTNQNCWRQLETRFKLTPGGDDESSPTLSIKYESNVGVFLRGAEKLLENDNFCIERVQNYGGICTTRTAAGPSTRLKDMSDPSYGANYEGHDELFIVFYFGDDSDQIARSYAIAIGVMWFITFGFVLSTAIINVTIVQRNSHGWLFFSYLMSSAVLNIVAGIFIILSAADEYNKDKVGCNFLDFFQKFLYLSTLCWLTSINFDLYYAFRLLNSKLEPTVQNSFKRLPFYLIFSWSLPILIITIGWFVGTHRLEDEHSISSHSRCIIYDYSIIFYMSGPVVLLILINLLLFIRTAMIIRGLRNASNKLLQKSDMERESFKLFTKLFLMTGPIWILRIVLLVLQIKELYLTWFGVLIELIYIIPDIAFFLLVIFHRKVVDRLKIRFPCLQARDNASKRNSGHPSGVNQSDGKSGGIADATSETPIGSSAKKSSIVRMVTFNDGQSKIVISKSNGAED